MTDNRSYKLVCCNLKQSLQIALSHHKVAGFYATPEELILFWTSSDKTTLLPAPLDVDGILPVVESWLENTADYGKEPSIDGNSKHSQVVETGGWGHVSEYGWQSICRITPHWALFGK